MTYPGANTSIPAHPSNIGSGVNHPKVVVYHTPEEPADNYAGTPRWFAREHPGQEGSTHYFVSWTGEVWLCVPEDRRAIANGVTAGRPYPAGTDPGVSLNLQSISIEIEGYAATIAQTLSVAQRKGLVDWTVYACTKYGIPADRQHIIGHYEVANNRSDPGTLPMYSIVAEVAARINGQEEDMWLLKGVPSGNLYVLDGGGKRYIDDVDELAIYSKRLTVDEWSDARIAQVPDMAGAVVGGAACSFLKELGLTKA